MAFSTNNSGISSDINVTPLIDVLLVLLIIFMVIVPTRPRGLDSSIPQGKAPATPTLGPVVVTVATGATPAMPTYRVDEKPVTFAELQPALTAAFATRNQPTLFIRADRALTYQKVAEVVSRSRTAGASAIALGTTDPQK